MKATEVREALLGKYPPDQYLSIYEAPQDSSRQGRRLDVLVASLWKSRGYELHGIEIKVSMSDWKRELDEPAKADWWHERVHRFSIAAPAEIAKKIRPQLPPGWGLLSIDGGGVRALVTPAANENLVPLTWPETIGLLRAAADAGVNALTRARRLGMEEGKAQAEAAIERNGGKLAPTVEEMQQRAAVGELARLREQIDQFEKESGIQIMQWGDHVTPGIGKLVALARQALRHPQAVEQALVHNADSLRRTAGQVDELRKAIAEGVGW